MNLSCFIPRLLCDIVPCVHIQLSHQSGRVHETMEGWEVAIISEYTHGLFLFHSTRQDISERVSFSCSVLLVSDYNERTDWMNVSIHSLHLFHRQKIIIWLVYTDWAGGRYVCFFGCFVSDRRDNIWSMVFFIRLLTLIHLTRLQKAKENTTILLSSPIFSLLVIWGPKWHCCVLCWWLTARKNMVRHVEYPPPVLHL